MNILVILSAKLVSNGLKNRFGAIPSGLIPFKGKTIFECLIEESQGIFDKVVLMTSENHYMFDEIISNLNFKNGFEKINIKKSNSLKDTVLALNRGFYINNNVSLVFGDTYISKDEMRKYRGANTTLIGEVLDSTRWTIVDNNKFLDKEILENKGSHKAVVGYFSFNNFELFVRELENQTFYDALYEYSIKNTMNFDYSISWIDVGHEDNYISSKKDNTRFFNTLKYNNVKGSVIKSSLDHTKIIQEIKWYLELPSEIKYVSPRIFNYSIEPDNAYVELEYYGYETLHEMFIYGNYSSEQWRVIFNNLGKYLNIFKEYSKFVEENQIKEDLYEMYIEKVKTRIKLLRKSTFKYRELLSGNLVINNISHESIDTCIVKLERLFDQLKVSLINRFSIIHGDFFFANILYDKLNNIIRLIDPRGNFGKSSLYGDSRYDYSKLLHSVNGLYDLIVEDKFSLVVKKNKVEYKLYKRDNHINARNAYFEYLEEENINIQHLLFIECTLFLSMIPLHSDNEERQVIMLCRGVELLDELWRRNND